MAVFSKGPEPHGTQRDAIDTEFSGWLTMPGSFSAVFESTMASRRRDRPNRGREGVRTGHRSAFFPDVANDDWAHSPQVDLLRFGARCPGDVELIGRTPRHHQSLAGIDTLSNRVARESDVSLWPDSGRKYFSKIILATDCIPGRIRS